MAETKIFSVAVSQGKAENSSNLMRNVVMKDVERQPVNRPVTLLPSSRAEIQHGGERPEITPSDEEFKPVQRDVEDAPGCVESLDMTDELESVLSQTAETTGEEEVKKTKKNKKKKNNNNPENNVDSSADDFKEVEVKPKKKKNKKQANVEEKEKEPEPSSVVQKEKTPEPEVKEKTPENDPAPQPVPRKLKNKKKQELELEEEKAKKEEEQLAEKFVGFEPEEEKFEGFERSKTPESFIPVESPTVEETATAMFEEFSKRSPPTKDKVSPNRDLVEFSEEESVVRVIEAEEDVEEEEEEDKVEFFIKEKSSSLEPEEESNMTSSGIDPMAARPNPWFEKFLKKSSSMIEDQIFGAVKKYEDVEEKGSEEEEGMEELEKNQADTEKNIADLLEDDEDLMMEPKIIASQPPSSNLSHLLKGESGKKNHVDDSSDDDFMFRPVVQQQKKNKKQKKQKGQVLSLEEFHRSASQPRETDSGSVADSESEKVSDQEGYSTNQGASKDGWSFEVDEEDVNKLLETEETEAVSVEQGSEERTDLEDVFRFDSEMHEDEEEG